MREVELVVYALVRLLADYLGERVPETKILVIFGVFFTHEVTQFYLT